MFVGSAAVTVVFLIQGYRGLGFIGFTSGSVMVQVMEGGGRGLSTTVPLKRALKAAPLNREEREHDFG